MAALDNLRKAAKRWLKSLRDGDPEARARLTRAYPEAPDRPTLRDVQHALARERGHDSWIAMTRAIAERRSPETPLALRLAVANKQPQAVAALIEAGADLNRVDAVGLTPLDQAALDGQDDIVQMLIAAGAVISLPAAMDGHTAADMARRRAMTDVAARLEQAAAGKR